MKIEIKGKREGEDVWKLPQHKVEDNGICLKSATP